MADENRQIESQKSSTGRRRPVVAKVRQVSNLADLVMIAPGEKPPDGMIVRRAGVLVADGG
jgi:hypothetical protein